MFCATVTQILQFRSGFHGYGPPPSPGSLLAILCQSCSFLSSHTFSCPFLYVPGRPITSWSYGSPGPPTRRPTCHPITSRPTSCHLCQSCSLLSSHTFSYQYTFSYVPGRPITSWSYGIPGPPTRRPICHPIISRPTSCHTALRALR